jgi:hypothetical protein
LGGASSIIPDGISIAAHANPVSSAQTAMNNQAKARKSPRNPIFRIVWLFFVEEAFQVRQINGFVHGIRGSEFVEA